MTLDVQLFYLMNGFAGHSAIVDWFIVFCAQYLPYLLVAAFAWLAFSKRRMLRERAEMLAVGLGAGFAARYGAVELIRSMYHHPRPFIALPGVHALFTDSSWSFPSGHASFFFALSTAAYLYDKRWGTAFFVASAFVAFSRVAAGVHYPSDIAAGILLGSAFGYGAYAISRNIGNSHRQ